MIFPNFCQKFVPIYTINSCALECMFTPLASSQLISQVKNIPLFRFALLCILNKNNYLFIHLLAICISFSVNCHVTGFIFCSFFTKYYITGTLSRTVTKSNIINKDCILFHSDYTIIILLLWDIQIVSNIFLNTYKFLDKELSGRKGMCVCVCCV